MIRRLRNWKCGLIVDRWVGPAIFAVFAFGSFSCLNPDMEPGERQLSISWEEFLAASTFHVDGQVLYIVEWDRPLPSKEALRHYYQQHIYNGPLTTREDSLIVNRVNGQDDIWNDQDARNLRYCVSTDFGSNHGRAVNEMNAATRAWERLANVIFEYVASQNTNCQGNNGQVTFAVRPWTGSGACAFFPSGGGCVERTLVINFNDLDTNPFYQNNAPNVTTEGVFRHELGHVLGFRHEHTRPQPGTCFEDNNWRELTPYDAWSVMHYPWCNGQLQADLSITDHDVKGSVALYGLSVPLLVSTTF